MKKTLIAITLTLALLANLAGQSAFRKEESNGVVFQWKIEGADLHIILSAPTRGWVAVGFNPSRAMKDADFKLAFVDGSTVVIEDHYGSGLFVHKKDSDLGGADNFTILGGSEKDGTTTVEFTMPLNSGDSSDSVLTAGSDTVVLLAYATSDDLTRKHRWRTSLNVKL